MQQKGCQPPQNPTKKKKKKEVFRVTLALHEAMLSTELWLPNKTNTITAIYIQSQRAAILLLEITMWFVLLYTAITV